MLIDALKARLTINAAKKLRRHHSVITARSHNDIKVDGSLRKNFASNDYLGLATHADVKKAFIAGIERYGVGSGSSVAVSGYYEPQELLECAFADFMQREAALFFNSGYHANLAVITTLCDRQSTVLSDKLCHASLLDGIQLSRAKHLRFQHHSIEHASELMQKGALIVTESVFSMEGDISPVRELSQLAKHHKGTLLVDDAHGIGVLGQSGRGIIEHLSLPSDAIACLVTPFGKAMGLMGAMVSGSDLLVDSLRQFAKSYRYTTAMPPAVAYAALTALEIVRKESWRGERLRGLTQFLVEKAKEYGVPLISSDPTPIKSIMVGSNQAVLDIKNQLEHAGYFISSIRPPTVPDGTARIRLSLNCMHEEEDIKKLIAIIASAYAKCQ
jgi:8-amino-7-oxononanoate synthase